MVVVCMGTRMEFVRGAIAPNFFFYELSKIQEKIRWKEDRRTNKSIDYNALTLLIVLQTYIVTYVQTEL